MALGNDKKSYIPTLNSRNAYKYIFRLFGISESSSKSHVRRNNIRYTLLQRTNTAFNILIVFFQVSVSIASFFCSDSKDKKRIVVFSSVSLTYCSFRIYLWIKNYEYKLIVKRIFLISNNIGYEPRVPSWIILWSILKFCIIIIAFAQYSIWMSSNLSFRELFCGYSIPNHYIDTCFPFLYLLSFILFFYVPLSVFDIYYAMVCNDIASMMNRFRQVIKNSAISNYNNWIDIYCEIISVAECFDSKVGFLVFITLLYHSFVMYYGFTMIFNTGVEDVKHFSVLVFTYFLSCVNFIARVESASRVYVASLAVKHEARKLQTGNYIIDCSYLRFLENCRETSMTVWGFINMRRNIILGTFGTILTYSLLFDNLMKFQ